MSNFFRGNTQPTTLQQTIEKITDGNQSSEDWSLIMNICDYVSTHEESAKEVMKLIRKRLQINPTTHGWRSIGYTLTLLEALVKNCGKIFHLQIAHKDFLKELKNVIGPKNNPPVPVQERVLGMIQTWALAFRQDSDLKAVDHFYQECKQQGLVFPPPESENAIQASVPATGTIERPNRSSVSHSHPPAAQSVTAQVMSADQVAKLRSELDVVQTNAQVFGEMLVTLQPGEEDPQDFELLMELHNTCKQMQTRIVDLLSQVSLDDITVDLLRYNDEFLNSFKTFEQYMQERDRRLSSTYNMPKVQPTIKKPLPPPDEPLLINFDDEPVTIGSNFQNMRLDPVPTNTASNSRGGAAATVEQDPERDAQEIEQWLRFQGDNTENEEQFPPPPAPSSSSTFRAEGGTTDAFNNFLQKRASKIPSEPPAPSSSTTMYPNLHSNTHH